LTIIGNLTKDPELRTTPNGIQVCSFTVAVNQRKRADGTQPEADFFRVNAWRELGVNCHKFLQKGKKVCVVGPVSIRTYQAQDGSTRANMEVLANEVEFLSPMASDATGAAQAAPQAQAPAPVDPQSGYQTATPSDLPF